MSTFSVPAHLYGLGGNDWIAGQGGGAGRGLATIGRKPGQARIFFIAFFSAIIFFHTIRSSGFLSAQGFQAN